MTLPLDPRKSPWKRGDVVTLGFEKNGFVLNYTPEYLEVLWMGSDGTVERVPTEQVENLLRVAHADSLSPDGSKTNLEKLKATQGLHQTSELIKQREKSFKNERERRQADDLGSYAGENLEPNTSHGLLGNWPPCGKD